MRVIPVATNGVGWDARAIVVGMEKGQGKPSLVSNPSDDATFAAHVDRLVERGAASPPELERGLRDVYPRATVHQRELAGERILVWYVYREGHWVRSTSQVGGMEPDAGSSRGPTGD
jgi:hypothetical protein